MRPRKPMIFLHKQQKKRMSLDNTWSLRFAAQRMRVEREESPARNVSHREKFARVLACRLMDIAISPEFN